MLQSASKVWVPEQQVKTALQKSRQEKMKAWMILSKSEADGNGLIFAMFLSSKNTGWKQFVDMAFEISIEVQIKPGETFLYLCS